MYDYIREPNVCGVRLLTPQYKDAGELRGYSLPTNQL